jgi:hypothetical protein
MEVHDWGKLDNLNDTVGRHPLPACKFFLVGSQEENSPRKRALELAVTLPEEGGGGDEGEEAGGGGFGDGEEWAEFFGKKEGG